MAEHTRLELGLSQTVLAARAGMTQPALSRLEAGGGIPTIGVLGQGTIPAWMFRLFAGDADLP